MLLKLTTEGIPPSQTENEYTREYGNHEINVHKTGDVWVARIYKQGEFVDEIPDQQHKRDAFAWAEDRIDSIHLHKARELLANLPEEL